MHVKAHAAPALKICAAEFVERDMDNGEIFYLCLVIGAMTAFGLALGYQSWQESRSDGD